MITVLLVLDSLLWFGCSCAYRESLSKSANMVGSVIGGLIVAAHLFGIYWLNFHI